MARYSPAYYTRGNIEVWDFIEDQDLNYFLGCAIKYICRAGHKDDKAQDISKAIHYLEHELQSTLAKQKSDGDGRVIPLGIWSRTVADTSGDDYAEEFDR